MTPVVPPMRVAVYTPPGVRELVGVKVPMVPVATSSTTDAAVTDVDAGAGPVTVNVVALTVLGFIRRPTGTVNVALTDAVGHTPVWPAAGLVDATEIFAGGRAAVAVVKVHT